MNTESMIVLAAVALLIVGAVYGCYRAIRNDKSCYGEHTKTQHCCVRCKSVIKHESVETPKKKSKGFEIRQMKKEEPAEEPQ